MTCLNRLLASAALAVPLVAGVGPAVAQVVRIVDEDGVIHYTNHPCQPRYARLVPETCPLAPGASVPAPSPASVPAPSPASAPATSVDLGSRIEAIALRHGVDARLVDAVIQVESARDPGAISPKGAMGLMQLMPGRATALGVRDVFDPVENLDGGVRHLRDLLTRYAGNLPLALAAYNAGEEAVRRHGGIPPYRETQEYVRKVLGRYHGGAGQMRTDAFAASP